MIGFVQSWKALVAIAEIVVGLATQRVQEARVPGRGIQSQFPTGGAFEHALAKAERGQYVDAASKFQAARGEFLNAIETRRVSVARGRLWVACATRHYAEALQLERNREQLARDGTDLHARAVRALLLHNQWAAREAYHGKRDARGAAEVERAYRAALDGVSGDDAALKQARLAFAGFLAQLDRGDEARKQFGRAFDPSDSPTEILAYAQHQLGDTSAALRTLGSLKQDADWPQIRERILVSNDFDTLADSEELARLIGSLD